MATQKPFKDSFNYLKEKDEYTRTTAAKPCRLFLTRGLELEEESSCI